MLTVLQDSFQIAKRQPLKEQTYQFFAPCADRCIGFLCDNAGLLMLIFRQVELVTLQQSKIMFY